MSKRRRREGLTLIEILLSLLVMVLGVLGILAVFPPSLQWSRMAIEETTAAIHAESIAHAFKNALQFGSYDVNSSEWTCVLAYDLKSRDMNKFVRYPFVLPKLGEGWKHYPANNGDPDKGMPIAAAFDPETAMHFDLCGDGWVFATMKNTHTLNDPTDPYWQFAFSFDVKKINSLEYLMKPQPQINPSTGSAYTESDLDKLTKLYEIRVHLFRVATQLSSTGGGTGTGPSSSTSKKLITTVGYRASTK